MKSKLGLFIERLKDEVLEKKDHEAIKLANTYALPLDKCITKQNEQGNEYFIFNLDSPRSLLIKADSATYRLIAHHLSFHKHANKEIAHFSEVHYTGYFIYNKEKYEVHVFFDDQDQLTLPEKIQFSKITSTGKIAQKSLALSLISGMVELAQDQYILVKNLRDAHADYISQLANKIDPLINNLENLSSQNDEASRTHYLNLLNAMLPELSKLAPLHPNIQYEKTLKWLIHLTKLTNHDWQPPPEIKFEKIIENKKDDSASQEKISYLCAKNKKKKTKNNNLNQPLSQRTSLKLNIVDIQKLIEQAKQGYAEFQALEKLIAAEKNKSEYATHPNPLNSRLLNAYQAFNHAITDADLALTHDMVIKHELLNEMNILIRKRSNEGIKLLEILLKNNEFILADQVKQCLPPLLESLTKFALSHDNAKLLTYLIKNAKLAINTCSIENGLTPIAFCYLKHTATCPKVETLKVLLKHGARLTSRIKQDQLCIANLILFDPQHALRKALPNDILNSKDFLQVLVNDIKNHLARNKNQLDEQHYVRLKNMIYDYEARINCEETLKTTAAELATVDMELLSAINTNEPVMIEHLVKTRTNLNIRSPLDYSTPILMAINNNDAKSVILLTTEKLKIDQENQLLAAAQQPLIETVDLDLADEQGDNPLIMAASFGHTALTQLLINAGANPNFQDKCGTTALLIAAFRNNFTLMEKLLMAPQIDVNIKNNAGMWPLLFVMKSKHADKINMMKLLLSKGANLKLVAEDHENDTILHYAFKHANFKIFQLLITAGADCLQKNDFGISPIQMAIGNDDVDIVKLMLNQLAQNSDEQLKSIIQEQSLVHLAAKLDCPKTLNYLIQFADINQTNHRGETPLYCAVLAGNILATKFLLDNKASTHISRKTDGKSPLHLATNLRRLDIIELLLAADAPINQVDILGGSALHIASSLGHSEIVKYLIIKKADQTIKDIKGYTAQDIAKSDHIRKLFSLQQPMISNPKLKTTHAMRAANKNSFFQSHSNTKSKLSAPPACERRADERRADPEFALDS